MRDDADVLIESVALRPPGRVCGEERARILRRLAGASFEPGAVRAGDWPWAKRLIGMRDPRGSRPITPQTSLSRGEWHFLKRILVDGWPPRLGVDGYFRLAADFGQTSTRLQTALDGRGCPILMAVALTPRTLVDQGVEKQLRLRYDPTVGYILTLHGEKPGDRRLSLYNNLEYR